jgi:hypothetical protein
MDSVILAQAMLLGLGFEVANQAALQQFQQNVEQAARHTRTLHIEFNIKQDFHAFDETEEYAGLLQLRRLGSGKTLIRLETRQKRKGGGSHCFLLIEDDLYILNAEETTAVKLDLSKVDKLQLLGEWLNPFILALDKEQMKQQYHPRVRKRDAFYTYLEIRPKSKSRGWLSGINQTRYVTLMNKASDEIPQGMPRQFRFADGMVESTIDIIKWKVNASGGPKEADFQRPEKMAGWKVISLGGDLGREAGK